MAGVDGDQIPQGKCGVYTKGAAKMALCVESVLQWGNDVVQVMNKI
jgi:hypothetical protein